MAQITIAEIREIEDPEALSKIIDQIRLDLFTIEAQLEWRDDDDQAWEARAIQALSFHRIALSEALRRERRITGKTADSQKASAERQLAKAIKKEATATNRITELEERKLREYKKRSQIHERGLMLLEAMSHGAAFRQAARSLLDEKVFEKIEAAAEKKISQAARNVVNQITEAA